MKFLQILLLIVFAPNVIFAQAQSPCAGTVTITDTSQAQPGILMVLTNSRQSSFTITGPKTFTGSGGMLAEQNVPPGTYTVTWNPVAGCETPAPETRATDSRGSVLFAGNYKDISKPVGYGLIEVRTSLNQPTTITVSGPATESVRGTSFTWATAPAGTYTVTYGDVFPFATPSPETQLLKPGGTINFFGNYVVKIPETFTLTVNSIPAGASVSIDGVSMGKEPIQMTVTKGEKHSIRCTLGGYDDYAYEYATGIPGDYVRGDVHTCNMVHKDYIPPGSWGITILSEPKGAKVFLDGAYIGVAPVQKLVPLAPATYAVLCTLAGYPDYAFDYVIPKFSIDAGVLGGGETCWMGLTRPAPARGAQGVQLLPDSQPKHEEVSPSPSQIQESGDRPRVPLSEPPKRGVVGKVMHAVSKFFSRLFSGLFRRTPTPLPPVVPRAPEDTLVGLWKIENLYTADTGGELKETVLQPSQRERYMEFTENQLCLEGNLDTEGAPIRCTNYVPLTLSGHTLSFPQPDGVAVHGTWTVTGGTLELNLALTHTQEGISQIIRAIFSKVDRPFSTTAQSTRETIPLQAVPRLDPAQQQTP